MSLEDFDPSKHGPVAVFFAAALGFLLYLIGKAKALFKNGDAAELKETLRDVRNDLKELDRKVDGIDTRLARMEGPHAVRSRSQS